jgi:superfamily II DNA/RNA helicase
LIFHIRQQPPLQPDDGPLAIVLAPTRELVQQIHHVAQPYFALFGIKSLCIIGGDEREKQINEIGDGKEVYICTPGRLEDFLESKITTLYRVTFIVLDEADKMLDSGFETQLRNILADFKTPKSAR